MEEWSASLCLRVKKTWRPLKMRLGVLQSRSERFAEETDLLLLQLIDLKSLSRPTRNPGAKPTQL
jgi:hypothetical protein